MLAIRTTIGRLLITNRQALVVSQRNARVVRRIFRQHLPKYKNNLYRLRPLTEQLTLEDLEQIHLGTEPQETERPKALLEHLWRDKLEIYKQYMPEEPRSRQLVEAMLNPDNDIDRILKIIDTNLPTMNSFYISVSFEVLDDFLRLNQCDIETVMVSPEYRRLCEKALLKIRFFMADELLKLLKCLATTRIPEDTLLVQSALQMTRHLLNDFNVKELETLGKCLGSFEVKEESGKSLLKALKLAIPVARKNIIRDNLYDKRLDAPTSTLIGSSSRQRNN